MGELPAAGAHPLDPRISALLQSTRSREAIIKTYVVNSYALRALGCGFTIARNALNSLMIRFFNEDIVDDIPTARKRIVEARKRLLAEYPEWIPNRFHVSIELFWSGKSRREEAKEAFLAALPLVEDMVIDSDHYAQLFIDARHNPLRLEEPWPVTNQMPWFVVKNMFDAFKDLFPRTDTPQIIERLKLK